jgi:hypothetical protein
MKEMKETGRYNRKQTKPRPDVELSATSNIKMKVDLPRNMPLGNIPNPCVASSILARGSIYFRRSGFYSSGLFLIVPLW